MKKRLIALMISGILISSTFTGCATQSVNEEWIGQPTIKDGYIIIEQNDNDILHKGSFYKAAQGNTNGFKFACDEEFQSNADFYGYYEEPKAELYDKKCKDCFNLE